MVHQLTPYVEFFFTETSHLHNSRPGEDSDIRQRHFRNTKLIYKYKK